MAKSMYAERDSLPLFNCSWRRAWLAGAALLMVVMAPVHGAEVVRKALDPGVMIALKGGRTLYLECRPPRGRDKAAFLKRYLADESSWQRYKSLRTVPIMYPNLKPAMKRHVIETMFPEDFADKRGWWHTVTYGGSRGVESWWNLAEWLTGKGTNYKELEALPENRGGSGTLEQGQVLFVPREMLLEVFRTPTPGRERRVILQPLEVTEEEVALVSSGDDDSGLPVPAVNPGDIRYGQDGQGAYAAYRLKKGEALYTSVVIRFTDFREVLIVREAAEEVLKRNDISDPRKLQVGQEIRIPLDMVSDRYQPPGSARRLAWEEANRDSERLSVRPAGSKDLEGVVVVLDPGHGGADHGAFHGNSIYEDEINYDIAVRIKRLLETTTRARVYMTLKDLSQGFEPTNATRFQHDEDEVVLTEPPYEPRDVRVSANLRWYLANGIYRQELARGTKPDNVLFASIHCDALYEKLRGTMVYIPGAVHRDGTRSLEEPPYARYTLAGYRTGSSTPSEARRDEALSRSFAETLLYSLQTNDPQIAVHRTSDPIRNVIQRSRTKRYVPAVLRYNDIPTKVLIETANLKNATDRQRVVDPDWRQWYAEAFVNAVKRHFTS